MSSGSQKGVAERRSNFRLRQLIDCAYGLTLFCAASQSVAGEPPRTVASNDAARDAGDEAGRHLPSARLIFLGLESFALSRDELNQFLQAPLQSSGPTRTAFLHAVDNVDLDSLEFKPHPVRSIKNGLGFDYALPSGGLVHFDLYQRSSMQREGLRFALNPVDRAGGGTDRNWSVGVSTDFVRTVEGQRSAHFKPQLLLDLDGLLNLKNTRIKAAVEYGHWYGARGLAVAEVQVAQLSLAAQF